jgi:hypothetical protein
MLSQGTIQAHTVNMNKKDTGSRKYVCFFKSLQEAEFRFVAQEYFRLTSLERGGHASRINFHARTLTLAAQNAHSTIH